MSSRAATAIPRAGQGLNLWWTLILVAAVSWGTTGTASTLLARQAAAAPLFVGLARMAAAAPLLWLAAWRLERRPGRAGASVLGAGLCMAAYQLCFFSAAPRAGVAVTALVAICSAPLIVAVLAAVVLGERLTPRIGAALLLGVAGAAGLAAGGAPAVGTQYRLGVVLALGAGLAYAVYAVVTKRAVGAAPPLRLAAQTFTVAALALTPTLLIAPPAGAVLRSGWPLLLYLGAVPTALAYALYTSGLRHTPATIATLVGLLEPLTATALGVLLFHERFDGLAVAGGGLLVGALLLLAAAGERAKPRERSMTEGPIGGKRR